jgi:hypothetical protein
MIRKTGMMGLVVYLTMFGLSGCAIEYKLFPEDPPSSLEAAEQPGHYRAPVEPKIVSMSTYAFCRYTVWHGVHKFTSLACSPSGLPKRGEPKCRCFLSYGGVKIDGSESSRLQRSRPGWWDYVYTADEQWKIAITDCGYPDVFDMGGTG